MDEFHPCEHERYSEKTLTEKNKVYTTLGASNHVPEEREKYDYYATDPEAVEMLLEMEKFNQYIWEPACGEGHISEVLKQHNYQVASTDLIDRGYGENFFNFLESEGEWVGDIITNPPYKHAQEFLEKSMELIKHGAKIAMFLKLTFLEGKRRAKMFERYPPKIIYVSSSRIRCAKSGDFNTDTSAVAYCWFIWIKGFKGEPIIKWFNK